MIGGGASLYTEKHMMAPVVTCAAQFAVIDWQRKQKDAVSQQRLLL